MPTHIALRGLLAGAALLTSHAVQAQGTYPSVIRWDTYGVPHIYGPDVLTVERGLGYAQMEAHAETILNTVARARGRAAEFFGAGDGNANVINDTNVRTLGIPARAAQWLAQGDKIHTPDGLTQSQLLTAFCAGANEYVQRNAATIDPRLQAILPILPTDVTAVEQSTIWFTFITNTDNIGGGNLSSPGLLESLWQTGGITAANAAARNMSPTGSNGWALGPTKSATGNPILMGNPHLPWGNNQPASGLGIYQWFESNLVVGNPYSPTLNASGVTFAGAPFLGIGFNDYLGWTHTNNTIQASNLYQLALDATGTHYSFGGTSLPLSIRTDSFLVKNLDTGALTRQTITIKSSIQGPVIATSNDGLTALALRVAGLDQPSLITQYWSMIEAQNLAQFTAADSLLQMPFFNVIYADRDGHIMYKYGGRQPVRRGGKWVDYSGILDGTDPTKLWTSTFTWDELPGTIDPSGGFVANSNNPPWTSTFPVPPELQHVNYPTYVAPDFMDFRPQHGATFLMSQPNFTVEQVLAGKMSTHMLLADRVLPDLLLAAQSSGDPIAQTAATILAAWDRTGDDTPTSAGGPLFEEWWDLVVADVAAGKLPADTTDNFYSPHPAFRIPWDRHHPLTTPVGLANAASLVSYLDTAYNNLQSTFAGRGGASVQWGDAHRSLLVSRDGFQQNIAGLVANDRQSGADDPFGPIRVTNPYPFSIIGFNEYITIGGDGWVQLVEFTPTGPNAQVLLDYGNASRPNSPHIGDQLPFFDAKTLRPALRKLGDVEAATVTTEQY